MSRAVATLGIASSPLNRASASGQCASFSKARRIGTVLEPSIAFLDWCVHEDRITANPCASIGRAYRPVAGGERERTPSLRDLALIWHGLPRRRSSSVFGDFIRFAITTPARRGEIANLRWEHLDLEVQGLGPTRQADQELQRARAAPQSARARDPDPALGGCGASRGGARVSFAAVNEATISAFSVMLRALHREAPNVASWSLHDLRRSFATTLGRLGQDDEVVIDGVLNHRQSRDPEPAFLGVYNRSTRLPAQAEALERWGRLIEDALEGRFPEEAEVISLVRRARP